MKLVEVAVTDGPSSVIEFVEIPVEAKQRAEDSGVKEIHQRVEFVDAVLNGRAGEHEGIAAFQTFHRLRCLGGPVLDSLGLIQDNHFGSKDSINVEAVAHHLFVVGDSEEGG